jgi:glycosyltransferase involved in cell wall biosynthesis
MSLTYEEVRAGQIAQRRESRTARQIPGLLCFVSTVWNTPRAFLRALAESVFAQDGGQSFEWLVLDNGTSDPETLAELKEIARFPFVRFHRVEKNLGIIGGMRWVLEAATARYILPLDSDDLLAPDCVLAMTRAIVAGNYPALLYSDEDLLDGHRYFNAYYKADFDPVLFVNSCYIAHLCAIDRARALELGCYSDPETEGSHDWDSFTRFMNAGHAPVHVPDLVYSWRVHQQSTSGNIASKPFVFNSQKRVLQRFIDAQPRPQDFEVVPSPLFNGSPDWWIRRKSIAGTRLLSIVVLSDPTSPPRLELPTDVHHSVEMVPAQSDARAILRILNHSDPSTELVHITYANAAIERGEWLLDAVGQLDLFPDAVMVGGIVHDGAQVTSASNLMGFGRGYDSPDAGRSLNDTGYLGAQMKKQRSAGAVSLAHCVVKRDFLVGTLKTSAAGAGSLAALALWLGAQARDSRHRVIFSPFFRCRMASPPEAAVTQAETFAILSMSRNRVPETELYSRHLGLSRATAYTALLPAERAAQGFAPDAVRPSYAEWLAEELKFRAFRYQVTGPVATLGIMTTVYPGSDWRLLDELYRSLSRQTQPFDEWVVVASGALGPDLVRVLDTMRAAPRIVIEYREQQLPISQSMRLQFELLSTDYTLPVDADDLLTIDALQILASVISRHPQADLVYSDEDLLIEGQPYHPYCRPGFDPVLNDETSYIWHLAAIRRETGIGLGLYMDDLATWTHDWDTAQLMQAAGANIVHAPEVLYHWRQHPKSLSNSGTGNTEQMKSVRHVLERRIARTAHPEGFVVADFPISRGSPIPELYIARSHTEVAPFAVVCSGSLAAAAMVHEVKMVGTPSGGGPTAHASFAEALADALGKTTPIIALIGRDATVDDWSSLAMEASRLFELHHDLAGVGGRLIGDDDRVAEACFVGLSDGTLQSPQVGLSAGDAGPFALALKPHSVAVLSPRLALFSAAFLASNRDRLIRCETREEFVLLASQLAWARGLRLAFSPLISARVAGAERRVMLGGNADDFPRNLGLSAFASAARYHV